MWEIIAAIAHYCAEEHNEEEFMGSMDRLISHGMGQLATELSRAAKLEFQMDGIDDAQGLIDSAHDFVKRSKRGDKPPIERSDLLKQADERATDAVNRLAQEDVRIVGAGAYAVAASLRLHILKERSQLEPTFQEDLATNAKAYWRFLEETIHQVRAKVDKRFKAVQGVTAGRLGVYSNFEFHVDGRRKGDLEPGSEEERCENFRRLKSEYILPIFQSRILPLQEVAANWRVIVNERPYGWRVHTVPRPGPEDDDRERFQLHPICGSDLKGSYRITTYSGSYLSVNDGDPSPTGGPGFGHRVHTCPFPGPAGQDRECFELQHIEKDWYYIKTYNGAYLSPNEQDVSPGSQSGYGRRIHTVQKHGEGFDAERFQIIDIGEGWYRIRTFNGQYLSPYDGDYSSNLP